jgi:hypothetical protein
MSAFARAGHPERAGTVAVRARNAASVGGHAWVTRSAATVRAPSAGSRISRLALIPYTALLAFDAVLATAVRPERHDPQTGEARRYRLPRPTKQVSAREPPKLSRLVQLGSRDTRRLVPAFPDSRCLRHQTWGDSLRLKEGQFFNRLDS